MAQFSAHSISQMEHLHPLLLGVLNAAIVGVDFRIDQGARTEEQQAENVRNGVSTTMNSWHIVQDDGYAYAADLWPYVHGRRLVVPTWTEIERRVIAGGARGFIQDAVAKYAQFAWMMRHVKEVGDRYLDAHLQNTGERWVLRFGVDWDGDGEILTDQGFDDYPHVELRRV